MEKLWGHDHAGSILKMRNSRHPHVKAVVGVTWEGEAKPHSRHPRTLERPRTKGRSPREE